jgi:hypothetical protein
VHKKNKDSIIVAVAGVVETLLVSTARGRPWSRAMRAVSASRQEHIAIIGYPISRGFIKVHKNILYTANLTFPSPFENCRQQKTLRTADSRIIELVERLELVITRIGKLEKGLQINENREK